MQTQSEEQISHLHAGWGRGAKPAASTPQRVESLCGRQQSWTSSSHFLLATEGRKGGNLHPSQE